MVDSEPELREQPRRSEFSSYIDRGYESDRGPQSGNYFSPPSQEPVAMANLYPGLKPYNPADYGGPPTQEERDMASRASRIQFYGPATYSEHPINSVLDTKESNVGLENLPQSEDNAHQPPPIDPVFPHIPAEQRHLFTSPYVNPLSPNKFPKARKTSTFPYSDTASLDSGTRRRERRQSTAQAKYTPTNYKPEFYAPSPSPISDRLERQLPPKAHDPSSPNERPQSFVPAFDIAQPYMESGPFIHQPGDPVFNVPQPNSTQQPVYSAYGTTFAPYATQTDPGYPPYDHRFSTHYSSPPPNSTGYYSPSNSPQPPRSCGSNDGDRDHDRTDNRSRNRSKRSSRLRKTLKEHKEIGPSALGALAGGLLGNELGHGRFMDTLLGAAVGGIGANFIETMREDERKFKQMKRRIRDDDELDEG